MAPSRSPPVFIEKETGQGIDRDDSREPMPARLHVFAMFLVSLSGTNRALCFSPNSASPKGGGPSADPRRSSIRRRPKERRTSWTGRFVRLPPRRTSLVSKACDRWDGAATVAASRNAGSRSTRYCFGRTTPRYCPGDTGHVRGRGKGSSEVREGPTCTRWRVDEEHPAGWGIAPSSWRSRPF